MLMRNFKTQRDLTSDGGKESTWWEPNAFDMN